MVPASVRQHENLDEGIQVRGGGSNKVPSRQKEKTKSEAAGCIGLHFV